MKNWIPRTRNRWRRSYFVWTALFVVAAYVGYQQVFSTFAAYDDEGYVMMSLRSFMDGQPLYDETFSQYGPAFYGIESAIHRVFSLPLTHDVTRLKTLGTWLLVAGMCALFVSRLTRKNPARSRGLSMLCFCMVFLHLDRLCLEPGHPQELCALGVASCLVISLWLSDRKRGIRVLATAGLGMINGIVLLTKLNVGLFLMTGLVAALVMSFPAGKPKTVLRWLVCIGLTALPLLVYRQHLLDIHASSLGWVTAVAAVALVCSTRKLVVETAVGWPELIGFFAMTAATVLTVLFWTLANGTTIEGLAYGIVTQHMALQQNFFHPPPVSIIWAMVGFVLLIWAQRSPRRISDFAFAAAAVAIVVCWLAYFRETWVPLTHGLQTRGQADVLISLVPGILGLLIVGARSSTTCAPRVVLACVALLQPLSAFPTPGTQTAVGTFALLVACVVLLSDGLAALPMSTRTNDVQAVSVQVVDRGVTDPSIHGNVPWQWAMFGAVVIAAICTLGLRSVYVAQYRAGLEPLALPGAQRLRLEKEFVRQQRWLVNQLRDHADTCVFGEHGQNSLYFWSQIAPPTSLNTTFWPFILRESDQRRIVQGLNAFDNACIVRTHFDAELPSGPLVEHIESDFCKALSDGDVEIWIRRNRHGNVSATDASEPSARNRS